MMRKEDRRLFLKIFGVTAFFLLCGIFYRLGGMGRVGGDGGNVRLEEAVLAEETVFLEESSRPEEPPALAADTSFDAEISEKTSAEAAASASSSLALYVYICGAVNNPDVYCFREGDRIADVLFLAGGFTQEAAQEFVNLARPLRDGERIYIPTKEETKGLSPLEGGSAFLSGDTSAFPAENAALAPGKINLNTATKEELMTLSGIGHAKAGAIIRWREENGAFSEIEDIMKVAGIKEAAFEKIKDDIVVR